MTDPYIAMVESMRRQKDRGFKTDPQSPIEDKEAFSGLAYYPVEPALRIPTKLTRHAAPATLTMQTSDGQAREYRNVGQFELVIDGAPVMLQAYQQRGSEALFLPFRDKTSGKETYGAGRYLDVHLERGEAAEVDFNLAYHPYCAYSEAYSCPFPPPENWLSVAVRAGERLPP
jgi:uncharacterized protein